MVDMSKPYIYIHKVSRMVGDSEKAKISFSVNGCANINEVSFQESGYEK